MTKRLHVPVTLSRYFSMLLRSNIFAALLQVGKEKEKEGKGKGGTILDELEDCIRPGHLHSSSVCVCVSNSSETSRGANQLPTRTDSCTLIAQHSG